MEELSKDYTNPCEKCGWITGVDGRGGNISTSQKPGQIFLEVNSDQKLNSLHTLLFNKKHLFLYHFSIFTGEKRN